MKVGRQPGSRRTAHRISLATRSEFNGHGKLLSRYRWAQDGTPLEVYVAET